MVLEGGVPRRLYERVAPVEKEVLLSCLSILNLMTSHYVQYTLLTIHTSFIQNYVQKYNFEESKSIWKGSLKKIWLENITKKCLRKFGMKWAYRVCRFMLWFCIVCLVSWLFAHIIFVWFCYDFASAFSENFIICYS